MHGVFLRLWFLFGAHKQEDMGLYVTVTGWLFFRGFVRLRKYVREKEEGKKSIRMEGKLIVKLLIFNGIFYFIIFLRKGKTFDLHALAMYITSFFFFFCFVMFSMFLSHPNLFNIKCKFNWKIPMTFGFSSTNFFSEHLYKTVYFSKKKKALHI